MGIEEQIRVTGADQAAQDIGRVADAGKHVGDETERAGHKADGASRDFDGLGDSAGGADKSMRGFVEGLAHGAMGFQVLVEWATKFREQLEHIVELQRELAEQSTGALETAMPLAEQWTDVSQGGLERALGVATQLRKQAMMPNLGAATSLAIAADINLAGGLNPAGDAEAFQRNMAIAGVVGGAIPLGTEATYGGVFEVLKAGGITDPEQIRLELARILAIQKQSQSASLATFVAGMASPGIKAFLAGGGGLSDAATLLLQAREAVTTDAQAATAADVILRAARGGTATRDFLAGKAAEFGFGEFDVLTDTQLVQLLERTFVQAAEGGPSAEAALLREGFEPGQFPVIKAAFAQSARGTAAKARAGAAQARGAEIDRKIRDFRESQIGREREQRADIEYSEALAGIDVYSISKLRELAETRNKLRLARPGVTGGEVFEAAIAAEEALVEREAIGILRERAGELAEQGIDVTAVLRVIDKTARGGFFTTGVSDKALYRANEAVNRAIGEVGQRGLPGAGAAPVNINVTNIGTNLVSENPEAYTEPVPDVGE